MPVTQRQKEHKGEPFSVRGGDVGRRPWVIGSNPEKRVLITRNSRDFAPLAREWAEAQRAHAGMILTWTLDHSQFAQIAAGVEQQLKVRPLQEQWRDMTAAF